MKKRNDFGAYAKDLWNLYRLCPEESCVTFSFYKDMETLWKEVTLWKNNEMSIHLPEDREQGKDALDYPSRTEAERKLYEAIGGFGFGPYRLSLEWNHGFGNSIHLRVYEG